jgi:hypothetical protein
MFFFRLFTLCSARVSLLVIVLCVRLAEASVTKNATLLGASRAINSKVMSAYTKHGEITSAKRNSGQKSTLTERDRRTLRIISKNHGTTAAQVNCGRIANST